MSPVCYLDINIGYCISLGYIWYLYLFIFIYMAEDKDCLGYGASAEVYSLMLLLNGCCGFNYSVTLR